jgi:hypothetical protein
MAVNQRKPENPGVLMIDFRPVVTVFGGKIGVPPRFPRYNI